MKKKCSVLLSLISSVIAVCSFANAAQSDTDKTLKAMTAKMQNLKFTIVGESYKDEWKTSYDFALDGKYLIINYKEDILSTYGKKNAQDRLVEDGVCTIDLSQVEKSKLTVKASQKHLLLKCVKGSECTTKDFSADYSKSGKKRSDKRIKKYVGTSFYAEPDLLNELREIILNLIP